LGIRKAWGDGHRRAALVGESRHFPYESCLANHVEALAEPVAPGGAVPLSLRARVGVRE
jgi:hypothetical protein